MPLHPIRFAIPALLLMLFLAGCAGTPPQTPEEAQADHARRLFVEGRYEAAADLYRALAESSAPPARDRYLLMAADSLMQAGRIDKGAALLSGLSAESLPAADRERLRLLQALLQMERGQPDQALALLQGLEESPDPAIRRRALALRARALEAAGKDPLALAGVLIRLDPLLEDRGQRLENQLRILTLLYRQPAARLREELADDDTTRGWIELAALVRGHPGGPESVQAAYREWRTLYAGHPALPELLPRWYETQQRLAPASIRRIAVLLPESGRFAGAAAAIRAGLLGAWYADRREDRPEIRFHDSSDIEQVWPLLHQVADDGVDLVIGPLSKDAVRQLARAGGVPLPVLALNQVATDTLPPERLYQYGLPPEQEARQAALWAAGKGLRKPGVLYPDSPLGERLLRAFRNAWLELGHDDPRTERYKPRENDYSDPVARLLGIPEARARHARLEKEAGEKLPFHPELPVDFVFVIGGHGDLLQLRPLIQFHHGTRLPVLTLSRVWKGRLARDELFDLAGVQLPEIPWLVLPAEQTGAPLSREEAERLFPEAMARYPRLVAMGMDAYALAGALRQLELPGATPLQGQTGELSLDARRMVRRRLLWISLGDPVQVLGPTPTPAMLESMAWEPPVPEGAGEAAVAGEGKGTGAPAPR